MQWKAGSAPTPLINVVSMTPCIPSPSPTYTLFTLSDFEGVESTPPKSEILIPCLADVASCGEVSVKTALIIDHLNHQNPNQNYCHEHEHVHHCHDLAVKVREVGEHICTHCHCCCHCYWKYEIKVPCSQSLSSVPQGRGELSFGRILVAALILPCNIIILN